MDGAFALDRVHEQLDRYHALISPYVIGPEASETSPYTQLDDASEFETSLSDDRRGLRVHIEGRHDVVQEALAED